MQLLLQHVRHSQEAQAEARYERKRPSRLHFALCLPHCAICQDYNEAKQRITSVSQPQIIMMQMPPQQQMQVVARS